MSDVEKNSIEYLKSRLYGNKGCKFIDVAQSDLRILLNLIEKQQKEIKELEKVYFNNKELINGLTIATGIALGGRTIEVSIKTIHELENTIRIEQVYVPETDSYRFRAI